MSGSTIDDGDERNTDRGGAEPTSPIVELAALGLQTQSHGEAFEARFASLTAGTGAARLGARLIEVPPGKRAWPHHCHHANDEIFIVLSGEGVLRYGADRFALRAGAVAVCPAGGVETAHQIINTGTAPLRYVAVSSMHHPDVMEYPDSGKATVFAGAAPGGDKAARSFSATLPLAAAVGYWDGEDGSEGR